MSAAKLRLISPQFLAEHLRGQPLSRALTQFARLASAELVIDEPSKDGSSTNGDQQIPIRYRGKPLGRIVYPSPANGASAQPVAAAMATLLEHMLEREVAIDDLGSALLAGYEELDLLYTLLPNVATKVDAAEIADVIVGSASSTLGCKRVSLMMLDESKERYRVMASRGLPEGVKNTFVPVTGSVATEGLGDEDFLIVGDIAERPDLSGLSRGEYRSTSFAVVRVPLTAHGATLGYLAVTERIDGGEFTTRDRKLLEGLSAMGASALLNCTLHRSVNRQMISTIHALASAIDAKDAYTHDHAGRVAQLCVATARERGITEPKKLREVELAGLLHDIGKIGIPDAILSKPSKLTAQEFGTMQNHVHIGARIVAHVPGLEGVAKAIRHHHERYDGLGYPAGLAGEAIPFASALIAVADTFDALTSDRPYRSAGSVEDALRELQATRCTQFNPEVVDAFVTLVESERAHAARDNRTEDTLISLRPALEPTGQDDW